MPLCYFYDSYYCIVRSWHSTVSGASACGADCKISTHFGMLFSFCKSSFPEENQWTSDPDSQVHSLQRVLQSSGCQGLAVPGACCSQRAFEHQLNGAGTNPPSPSSKQGVQVQAPLSERLLLCCQVWTSHSHSAAEAAFPALNSPAAWPETQQLLQSSSSLTRSQKWFQISCHRTAPKPPDAPLVPPGNGFSYMSSCGAAKLSSEPGSVSVLAHGACPGLALSCVQQLLGVG